MTPAVPSICLRVGSKTGINRVRAVPPSTTSNSDKLLIANFDCTLHALEDSRAHLVAGTRPANKLEHCLPKPTPDHVYVLGSA